MADSGKDFAVARNSATPKLLPEAQTQYWPLVLMGSGISHERAEINYVTPTLRAGSRS